MKETPAKKVKVGINDTFLTQIKEKPMVYKRR